MESREGPTRASGLVLRRWARTVAWALCAIGAAGSAWAASPAAGTKILNQATITYTDAIGRDRTATTNEVALVVQRVYSATLEADSAAKAAPGGDALFYHRLQNTGNGSDVFCLSVATDATKAYNFKSLKIIRDLDEDGEADTADPVLVTLGGTPAVGAITLGQDESVMLIVQGVTPTGRAEGDQMGAILTAQAQKETGACVAATVTDIGANADGLADTNQDVATITDDAILRVSKSSDYLSGGAGFADDRIRYTVTARNIGVSPAASVTISDAAPTGTAYAAASVAAVTGTFATLGESGGTVTGTLATLAAGASASFSFEVDLNDSLTAGDEIVNVATAQGDLDGAAGLEPAVSSNKTVDLIAAGRALRLDDTGTGASAALNDGGDDDGTSNDVQLVSSAPFMGQPLFRLKAQNTGNADDVFEFSLSNVSFPAGTVFSIRSADGYTRLLDADGDGWVETGPLAPGESRFVTVVAMLPAGATAGPYDATVTLRADEQPTLTDTATLRLGTVEPARLDLAANLGAAFNDGGAANQDPPTAAAATLAATPGVAISQPLSIANEGSAAESYLISVWTDLAGTIRPPAEWKIIPVNASGVPTNVFGPASAGGTAPFALSITPPADAAPGSYSFYVEAEGGASGAADMVRIDVTLGEAATGALQFSPDRSGMVAPCSTIDYLHRVANGGNGPQNVKVAITAQSLLTSALDWPTGPAAAEPTAFTPAAGLSVGSVVSVYHAASGAWGATALISDGAGGLAIRLDAGEWTLIRVRVIAACDQPERASDTLTVTASTLDGAHSLSVTDTTMVAKAVLSIQKAGAPDAACDGAPDGAFVVGGVSAAPAQCVIWSLTVRNNGVETVCDVQLNDEAPAFTILQGAPYIVSEPPPGGGSCAVSGSSVSCGVGPNRDINGDGTAESRCLQAGESAEARFAVRIE